MDKLTRMEPKNNLINLRVGPKKFDNWTYFFSVQGWILHFSSTAKIKLIHAAESSEQIEFSSRRRAPGGMPAAPMQEFSGIFNHSTLAAARKCFWKKYSHLGTRGLVVFFIQHICDWFNMKRL